ncbi:MAG: hypothetical protein ACK5EU_05090 [Pseudanabaena sp.]|jgi:hypothetical protein|nr:hypothetical protein [Pseudanabaena sp. M53BS1SP1A06MG]MCA6590839.1 hypothetical protein [Pseudanabaena sp. M38BS1SP1A06MG]MCA6595924.1 hypothetical protein [Pseudanabaena sp. M046S1SP1A06QC]MCA6601165.1 hypothetical protein [Pseudanabaena sp. M57BS1SP1A06MG]
MSVVALKVQNMNTRNVSLGAVAGTGWFGYTAYQRSIHESFLASAEEITTKISSDNAPASLDVLSARQKNIDVAISTLNKIPPSSGDIYRKAQERWNKLKELDAQLTQRIENEKLALSSFEKAKSLHEEIVKEYNSRNLSLEELRVSLAKYQEVIFLLEKLPADTSIAAEVNKALKDFSKSNDTMLTAYRNKESVAREVAERQRQQEADKQRQHELRMLERQAQLEIQKSMIESVGRRREAIINRPTRILVD